MSDFVLFELRIMQERTNYLVFNQLCMVGLPKMLVFKKTMTIWQMKVELYKLLREAFKIKRRKNVEQEYKDLFKRPRTSGKDSGASSAPYSLEIFNNMPVDTPCPICNNRVHNTTNCSFEFDHEQTMTIDDLLAMVDREVQIIVNFPASKDLPFEVDFDAYEYKDQVTAINLDQESANLGNV